MGDLQNASLDLYSEPGSLCFVPPEGSSPPCLSTLSPRSYFQSPSVNSVFPDSLQPSDRISDPSIPITLLSVGEFKRKKD